MYIYIYTYVHTLMLLYIVYDVCNTVAREPFRPSLLPRPEGPRSYLRAAPSLVQM